jgi:hemoglobin-like flavoprotein
MQLEINVPSTLSEIPLKSYQKFLKVQEGSNDPEFIAQKMVQIFCDIELKDIVKMKLTSLNELIVHFKNLFEQKPKFQPTFKIGNQEFGFITKLEDITFGEYVDLENNLLKWDDYHKAMAVLYRPIKMKFKDKYEIVDYTPLEEMQELMKFTPVDIAISSSIFFWNLGAELLTASLTYLEKEIKKNPKMLTNLVNKLNLENNGDGIKAFMRSQEETLQNLTQLPDMDLLSVSPISPSKNKSKKLNNANLIN